MRRSHGFFLGLTVLCLACGGGGGGDGDPSVSVTGSGGGGSTIFPLNFIGDQPNPGPDTVSASRSSGSGNTVLVAVDVTDTNNLFGAGFDVVFDPTVVRFTRSIPGNALDSGSGSPAPIVNEPRAGLLVVSVSSDGGEVDVTGTRPLVLLEFQSLQAGASALTLRNGTLENASQQLLPGISWFGGAFDASAP